MKARTLPVRKALRVLQDQRVLPAQALRVQGKQALPVQPVPLVKLEQGKQALLVQLARLARLELELVSRVQLVRRARLAQLVSRELELV